MLSVTAKPIEPMGLLVSLSFSTLVVLQNMQE